MQIDEISKHVGKTVDLRGWIHRIRSSKGIVFMALRDYTGIVQCVVKDGIPGFKEAEGTGMEASVSLEGKVRKDERAPGGFEVEVKDFKLVGPSDNFPIREFQSPEFLLDYRHLWVRSQKLTKIFKIRSDVFGLIHEFFRKRGFYEMQSPSLTQIACEGGSTLFEVNYFGQKAYLTQSWQLHAEAMIPVLEKIYCIAPSFRAEKSRTRKHLAEYWHAEAEAAWTDHEGSMKLQEDMVSYVVQRVIKMRKKELRELGRDIKKLEHIKPPFPRITYEKAIEMLKKDGIRRKWGDDFGAPEERVLAKHFKKPFFVEKWPKYSKAFYMKESGDGKTVLCDDLFMPEGYGELIGGSERETDIKTLLRRMKEFKLKRKPYEFYLDLRRYGSVPHSGFGLGIERFVMWICGIDHIRDTIAFPRVMNRIHP
ncbi:MAG: asparagine--tRNA ligase [Candidatus Aenigmatarchaeota archaeon]|nr:MAG: asparagine--tRNA ligase [Candidatus Aenigmarchaeota archaeon]